MTNSSARGEVECEIAESTKCGRRSRVVYSDIRRTDSTASPGVVQVGRMLSPPVGRSSWTPSTWSTKARRDRRRGCGTEGGGW